METKVMIVVEGDLYGRLLAKEFRSRGYGVCAVLENGEDAVKKAKTAKPDTVLLEFMLKGNMDGIETAKRIQESFPASVVFLNNRHEKDWIYRAGEVHSSSIVNKQDVPLKMVVDMVRTATA